MRDRNRTTFKTEVQAAGQKLSPARAGLLFARELAYPDLRPSDYLIQLDDLAAAAHPFMETHRTARNRWLALAEFLFQRLNFSGNQLDYYNPLNSYLNEVLDRRLGIPISLSVIYLEVGWRLGLPVVGVGLPGHFIVSVTDHSEPLYLDPFHGGVELTLDDCARLVQEASGHRGGFDGRWLTPTTPREITARMLNNLRGFYAQKEDWLLAAAVLERLHVLQQGVSSHLRDLGLVHYRNESFRQALQFLDQYLAREPDAPDFDSVRQSRDLLFEHLMRLN